jgi:hypothetical protein
VNKKVLVFSVIVIIAVLGASFVLQSSGRKEEAISIPSTPVPSVEITEQAAVDFNASFAIFTHSTFRIFTAAMYHDLSDDVFIEGSNPNIVHVRKAGITWSDFFQTLPFSLDKECLTTGTGQTFCDREGGRLRFFINGIEDPDALNKVINEGDQLLVSFGNESEEDIQDQLQKVPRTN